MKTILVIDGAENCGLDHFQASDALFALLFPGEGQDIEFIEDFWDRHTGKDHEAEFAQLRARPVRKKDVEGVDGLLFYGLQHKKVFYPNKKDSDLDGTGRGWNSGER